ncbi:MAG: agmatine deiminase family protein, partial [Lysobacteraceae bacterium]
AWPHAGTDWAARLESVESTYAALIAAITRFQPVLLCVADDAVRQRAANCLSHAGVVLDKVRMVLVDYDDTWLRDTGPITLLGNDGPVMLDFHFNAWGGKYDAGRDDRLIAGLFEQGVFGNARRERVEFTLEGGSVETDGLGTLLTSRQCQHCRHPGSSRAQISKKLTAILRQDRVLWIDYGYLEGDDTDAHVDTLARFASADSLVYQACDDQNDAHFEEMRAMSVELASMRTADDKPYRLFALPWAREIMDGDRRLAASYANFLIINGAVLVPGYDDPADAKALEVIAQAFPDREIVQIPCKPLIWQNGSLHCLSMQLPQGVM